MNASQNKKLLVSLIINLIVVASEVVSLIMYATQRGAAMFCFYTEDSNILALIACVLMAVFTLKTIKNGGKIPEWTYILKYMVACCLSVTFIVVVTVLAPPQGVDGYVDMLLNGPMFFHHFFCPVLVVVSLILFDCPARFPIKHMFTAVAPTLLYATLIIILNAVRAVYGPYPFLHIYEQPIYMTIIWCVVIIGGDFLIAALLRLVMNKVGKKQLCS